MIKTKVTINRIR